MESYPSISSVPIIGVHVYAFDKIDGSQIRAEWSKKRGFYKLGSRKQLIGSTNYLAQAQTCLDAKYAEPLAKVFSQLRWDRALAFFELAGPNSFAGSHDPNDELDLTLFDVAHPKQGILPPKDFIKTLGHLPTPEVVHTGMLEDEDIEAIRNSDLREGVVCKAKGKKGPIMFKIKTEHWIARVRERYQGNPEKLRELL
jgi:hypothetical protein